MMTQVISHFWETWSGVYGTIFSLNTITHMKFNLYFIMFSYKIFKGIEKKYVDI